ncbi:MAG: response regulator [Jatrophihabitans sp.]|uniref:response regulator n=1 Tax=Jatrophihabitans sp. TaxID=1932789 RepID=UPI003912DB78
MIRVVVVDDQALVRGGFRAILTADPDIDVVGEGGTGADAVALVHDLHPDVALIDVRMPGMDGIEATRHITTSSDGCRVLILTTFDVDEHVYDAFRAGASGFLLKTVAPEDLAAAVRAVYAGEALLAPTITRRLIERFVSSPSPTADQRLQSLTDREVEVLHLIARGRSNSEIGAELYLSHGTVKTHVSRILTKLDARDRVQAVVLAYETGLVQPGHANS